MTKSNYINFKNKREIKKVNYSKYNFPFYCFVIFSSIAMGVWGGSGLLTGDWSITNYKSYDKFLDECIKKKRYEQKVDSTYNTLFDSAKTFDDSLKIYEKYGLPMKLELKKPSFEEKEKIVKENELEKSLK